MTMRFVKCLQKGGKEITEFGKLRKSLARHKVELAYLFGSHGRGKPTKFSDIDIGVVFKRGADKKKLLDSLRADLTRVLGEEAIDLVDLEEAPPRLKYNAVREGKVILGEKLCKAFEVRAMKEYFDFRPLEDMYFRRMEERIKRGEYGR